MSSQQQNQCIYKPQRTGWKFDLKRGTRIRVITEVEGCLEGFAAVGCDATSNYLELLQCVRYCGKDFKKEEGKEYIGYIRIDGDDVTSEIIDPEVKPPPVKALPTERLCRTFIVSTHKELDRLATLLKDVPKLALNFYGVFVGRDGTVSWITLYVENTLVCIDIQEWERETNRLWKVLKDSIFSNEKICKVVYNVRPIQDYLWHKQSIILKNVEDIQVTEAETWIKSKSAVELMKGNTNLILKYTPLSEMLETYMKDIVQPEEVKLLKDFESKDFSKECPLTKTPVPEEQKYCKCVALQMKYLMQLQTILIGMLLTDHIYSTNVQMVELMNARNDKMEDQIIDPLNIPENVLRSFLKHFYDGSRPA